MYLDFYGLIEKPFSLTPDPKYFFASGGHAEARDLLCYGVREREGFMCFVGAAGTGKTILLRTVLESFGDEVVTALVLNPFLSEEDLLRIVLVDLGAASRQEMESDRRVYSKQQLIDRLNEHLMRLSMEGRAAVLVIDEAQNLPMPVMEQIRLLSNLETSKSKLLQIVLAGQLGLRKHLQAPELSQLAQRVSVRYTLQPLTVAEIGRYIDHRLRVAGNAGEVVFDRGAIQRVFRYSEGVPRLVNLVCDRSLLAGYAQRTGRITGSIVDRAAETLDLAEPGTPPPIEREDESEPSRAPRLFGLETWAEKAAGVVAIVAALVLTAVWGYVWLGGGQQLEAMRLPRAEAAYEVPEDPAGTGPVPALPERQPVDLVRPTGAYTVYVSSFRRPDAAGLIELRRRLHDGDLETYVVSADVPGQGMLHRLIVGDFDARSSAAAAAADLKEDMGIPHAEVVAVADVLGDPKP